MSPAKLNKSEELMKHRKHFQAQLKPLFRVIDGMKSVRDLFIGQTIVGVEVIGMRRQAWKGNRKVLLGNGKRKIQANTYASNKVGMYAAGAEEFVEVRKPQ